MTDRLSVVLPILAGEPERRRNLELVASALLDAGVDEVIIADQQVDGGEPVEVAGTQRVAVAARRTLIERSRLVNLAALEATGDRLWVHDPDLILPFDEVVDRLESEPAVLIKPFGAYVKLSRRDTERFWATRRIDARFFEDRRRLGETMGKGSYVIDRELFLALGGLHEGFVGEADEGFELVRRLRCLVKDSATFDDLSGLALSRPFGEAERRQREDNKRLRQRLTARLEGELEAYLEASLQSSITPSWPRLRQLAGRAYRAAALRVTEGHRPPERPARLGGELWGVTTYFNPARWRTKLENYRHFRRGLQRQGLPLLAVELAFPGQPFALDDGDAEHLIQLRAGDVLWQKERLLNLGIEALPERCDKVVWLDADVLFAEPRWVARTAALLERYVVVQPFSLSVRLRHGERWCDTDGLPLGNAEHQVLHSIAYGVMAKGPECLDRYLVHGHSGYAWAGRRSVLARHGLYDANILGNADLNIAHAMFGGPDLLRVGRLSDKARSHLDRWAEAFGAEVAGSVAHLDGTLFHLWHGDHRDRRYGERLRVLIDNDFDPEVDLAIDPASGAWRWASDKPALHQWCRDYFRVRREDPEG